MIFDEILSSLNNESREVVFEILNKKKEEHTIIVIDNNEQILSMCDNIVLLNESEVLCEGEFSEVKKNKMFKTICES